MKCIRGSEQECPENFGNNDDSTCFPLDENGDWVCPEGYHNVDDEETGQCYPNEEGCEYDDYVLLTDRPGKDDRCASLYYLCSPIGGTAEERNHPACDEWREECIPIMTSLQMILKAISATVHHSQIHAMTEIMTRKNSVLITLSSETTALAVHSNDQIGM